MPNDPFTTLYVVGLVGSGLLRKCYAWRYRRLRVVLRRTDVLDALLVCVASVGLVLPIVYVVTSWPAFADYPLPAWARGIGAAVFLAALWLLWRAHADLGRHWSVALELRERHALVTHGVYRRLRHPMYAAHWLLGIAQVLLLPNWLAGPALLVTFLPLYLVRTPREERMLLDHFGDAYRTYLARTGRIFPRLRGRPRGSHAETAEGKGSGSQVPGCGGGQKPFDVGGSSGSEPGV